MTAERKDNLHRQIDTFPISWISVELTGQRNLRAIQKTKVIYHIETEERISEFLLF